MEATKGLNHATNQLNNEMQKSRDQDFRKLRIFLWRKLDHYNRLQDIPVIHLKHE